MRRRLIKCMYRQTTTNRDHECTQCGQTIYSHSVAEREVWEEQDGRLSAEYYHVAPACPDRYHE